ncbi:hypothetical protein PENSPDRAFT_757746 [Peniophora sp. CONT]|nr:hypothetical protein PENSPDRAFT_757746 [Peniophora sp. CONT]
MESPCSPANATATTGVKRKRLSEPDAPIPPAFTPEKYSDMCFDDASIVLQCLPSSCAFRVHRGLLVVHSEVFKDMFALAQPDPKSGTLPVVHVHDDPGKVYRLLKYIYFRQPPLEEPGYLDAVLDILELSLKYMVPVAREDCVSILRRIFPATLSLHESASGERVKYALNQKQYLRCLRLVMTPQYWTLVPSIYACLLQVKLRMGHMREALPDYVSAFTMATVLQARERLQILRRDTVQVYIRDFVAQPSLHHCGPKLARIALGYLYQHTDSEDFMDVTTIFQNQPLAANCAPGVDQTL